MFLILQLNPVLPVAQVVQEFLDLKREQVDILEEDMKDKVKDDVEKLSGDELAEVQEYVRNKIYCKSSIGKK